MLCIYLCTVRAFSSVYFPHRPSPGITLYQCHLLKRNTVCYDRFYDLYSFITLRDEEIKQHGKISKTGGPSYDYCIFADTRGKFSGTCVLPWLRGYRSFVRCRTQVLDLSPRFLFPRHPASRKFPTITSSNLATRSPDGCLQTKLFANSVPLAHYSRAVEHFLSGPGFTPGQTEIN